MDRIAKDRYTVRATDCDYNGRLRMDALFIMMQEGAEHNAAALGASHEQMLRRNLFFALTRMHVRITRMPRFNETVLHSTWPGIANRFFFPRYHTLTLEDGTPLAAAAGLWVTLDTEKRTVVSPVKADLGFPDTSDLPAPCEEPMKMPAGCTGEAVVSARSPLYSDYDLNGHVNNTRYISWLCDALGKSAFDGDALSDLVVSYEKEIRDEAPLTQQLIRGGNAFSYRLLSPEGTRHFEAKGAFAGRDCHV
ncbi:MAG: hypothetical protein IJ573_10410 [Clostridia bacterium]|nr:hypothetical protein [Clostridia bacterium]